MGETGGKDRRRPPERRPRRAAGAPLRGAFEFQGQKCSTPRRVRREVGLDDRWATSSLTTTSRWATSPTSRTSWVRSSTTARSPRLTRRRARGTRRNAPTVADGGADDSVGYFCPAHRSSESTDPTDQMFSGRVLRPDPRGPRLRRRARGHDRVLAHDGVVRAVCPHRSRSSPRTGGPLADARETCASPAGNFYINDKPTGAPWSASSRSAVPAPPAPNDKAGPRQNLMRWTSPRADQGDLRPAQGPPLPRHGLIRLPAVWPVRWLRCEERQRRASKRRTPSPRSIRIGARFRGWVCRWVRFANGPTTSTTTVEVPDTASGVLAFAREQRAVADRAERRLLEAAVQWAIHPAATLDLRARSASLRRRDRGAVGGGLGRRWWRSSVWRSCGCGRVAPRRGSTTSVTPWSGLPPPELWARATAGALAAWKARQVAHETIGHSLSMEAVGFVDTHVVAGGAPDQARPAREAGR